MWMMSGALGAFTGTVAATVLLLLVMESQMGQCQDAVVLPLADRSVELACPEGEVILLPERDRIHQYTESSPCRLTNRLFTLPIQCSGRRRCTVTPKVPRRCGDGEILSINYTCVAVSEINSACGEEELTGREGYIQSPAFPSPYPANSLCTWRLSPLPAGSKVVLTIYDLELQRPYNSSLCRDYLEIHVRHEHTYFYQCGEMRQPQRVVLTDAPTITFRSDPYSSSRGFFLRYAIRDLGDDENEEDIGSNTITIPAPTGFPTLPYRRYKPAVEAISPVEGDNNQVGEAATGRGQGTKKGDSEEETDSAAVAGIVIGALLLLLIIIVIIVVIIVLMRRRKGSQRYDDEEKQGIGGGSAGTSPQNGKKSSAAVPEKNGEVKDTAFTESGGGDGGQMNGGGGGGYHNGVGEQGKNGYA